MNLYSNAIKYNKIGGKVLIYMAWIPHNSPQELLDPIQEAHEIVKQAKTSFFDTMNHVGTLDENGLDLLSSAKQSQ